MINKGHLYFKFYMLKCISDGQRQQHSKKEPSMTSIIIFAGHQGLFLQPQNIKLLPPSLSVFDLYREEWQIFHQIPQATQKKKKKLWCFVSGFLWFWVFFGFLVAKDSVWVKCKSVDSKTWFFTLHCTSSHIQIFLPFVFLCTCFAYIWLPKQKNFSYSQGVLG